MPHLAHGKLRSVLQRYCQIPRRNGCLLTPTAMTMVSPGALCPAGVGVPAGLGWRGGRWDHPATPQPHPQPREEAVNSSHCRLSWVCLSRPLPGSGLFPSSQGLGALVGRERVSQSTDTCLSPLAPPGEEYRPLLLYPETTAQILVQALNPLDYRKWRTKPMYWRVLKVFKVRGAPGARLLTW